MLSNIFRRIGLAMVGAAWLSLVVAVGAGPAFAITNTPSCRADPFGHASCDTPSHFPLLLVLSLGGGLLIAFLLKLREK